MKSSERWGLALIGAFAAIIFWGGYVTGERAEEKRAFEVGDYVFRRMAGHFDEVCVPRTEEIRP